MESRTTNNYKMIRKVLILILTLHFSNMQAQDKIIVWKSTYVNTTEFTTIKFNDKIQADKIRSTKNLKQTCLRRQFWSPVIVAIAKKLIKN
jgi:hypothetical protein